MRKLIVLSVISVSIISAKADLTWDWTYVQNSDIAVEGAGDTGSGTFTTDAGNGLGAYNITSFSGTFAGDTITGIDHVYSTGTQLFYPGFAFGDSPETLALDGADGNTLALSSFDGSEVVVEDIQDSINGGAGFETGNFSISPVPEPATWAGISAAMLGVVYFAKRRLMSVRPQV